jgi:hypothetical protein
MPWKINGERWHLSDKGFPWGKSRQWPASLLSAMVAIVQQAIPEVAFDWGYRDAVVLRLPNVRHAWARWKTKQPEALECAFAIPKGQCNLAQLEGIGSGQELDTSRADVDIVRWTFRREEELVGARLQELLRRLADVFQQRFASP